MKGISLILVAGLTLAATFLSGCAKEAQGGNTGNGTGGTHNKRIQVTINTDEDFLTRTSYEGDGIDHAIHWCEGDRLGVYAYTKDGDLKFAENEPFDIVEYEGAMAIFNGHMDDQGIGSDIHNIIYHAYYPYQECTLDNGILTVDVPNQQYPTSTSYDGRADFFYSATIDTHAKLGEMETEGGYSPLRFAFTRPVAIVKFDFANLPEEAIGEKIETISFGIPGENIAGEIKVDLSDCSYTNGTATSGVINLNYENNDILLDADFCAWITMLPISTRTFTLTIVTENHTITKNVETESALEFKANNINRATLNLYAGTTTVSRKATFSVLPSMFSTSYVTGDKEGYDSNGETISFYSFGVKRDEDMIVWQNSTNRRLYNTSDLGRISSIEILGLSGGILQVYEGSSPDPDGAPISPTIEGPDYIYTLSGTNGYFTIRHPNTSVSYTSGIIVTFKR